MILVDTSVWVNHLRGAEEDLARLIERDAVSTHPFVIGEIALGQIQQRALVLKSLEALPKACVATDREILRFVERGVLFGRGVGHVDVSLLAAASLTANTWLWTFDKKLAAAASKMGVAASPPFPAHTLG